MKGFPEDLFASEVTDCVKGELKLFAKGELTREQARKAIIDGVERRVDIALNTIASRLPEGNGRKEPPEFVTYSDAAGVLAPYWGGEQVDDLADRIVNDSNVSALAYKYAVAATQKDSPERAKVDRANDFLWADSGRD